MIMPVPIPFESLTPGMLVHAEVRRQLLDLVSHDVSEDELRRIEQADTESVVLSLGGKLYLCKVHFEPSSRDPEPEEGCQCEEDVEDEFDVVQVKLAKSTPVYRTQDEALIAGITNSLDDMKKVGDSLRTIRSRVRSDS